MSPVLESIFDKAKADAENHHRPSGGEKAQDEQQMMMTFLTSCCSDSDQDVLGTLEPSEPAMAGEQVQQMCSMMSGGGPPPHNVRASIAKLFGLAPLMSHGGVPVAPKTSLGAAAIGAFAGGAVVASIMVMKFGKVRVDTPPLLG